MILAADIGGTKTLLALFDDAGTHVIAMKRYVSADASDHGGTFLSTDFTDYTDYSRL